MAVAGMVAFGSKPTVRDMAFVEGKAVEESKAIAENKVVAHGHKATVSGCKVIVEGLAVGGGVEARWGSCGGRG